MCSKRSQYNNYCILEKLKKKLLSSKSSQDTKYCIADVF